MTYIAGFNPVEEKNLKYLSTAWWLDQRNCVTNCAWHAMRAAI
jgi:hypothetical protein